MSLLAPLKRIIRQHFGFSKAETQGTLALIVLTSLGLWMPSMAKWYCSSQPTHTPPQDIEQLDQLYTQLAQSHKNTSTQPTPQTSPHTKHPARRIQQPFDINQANQAQLCTVPGIGTVLSARIIKYRNKLGGFVHPSQYTEVYGLSPNAVQHLKAQSYIQQGFCPERLHLNSASVTLLAAHPYLTYKQAQGIVRYRKQHGPYPTVEAIDKLIQIDKRTLTKITPYLTAAVK